MTNEEIWLFVSNNHFKLDVYKGYVYPKLINGFELTLIVQYGLYSFCMKKLLGGMLINIELKPRKLDDITLYDFKQEMTRFVKKTKQLDFYNNMQNDATRI